MLFLKRDWLKTLAAAILLSGLYAPAKADIAPDPTSGGRSLSLTEEGKKTAVIMTFEGISRDQIVEIRPPATKITDQVLKPSDARRSTVHIRTNVPSGIFF